jgi:hypothetical protein
LHPSALYLYDTLLLLIKKKNIPPASALLPTSPLPLPFWWTA